MNYMELLHLIPTELKTKFRKCENLKIKLINNLWSTTFNEMCIKENLMPKYTRVYYIYDTFIIHILSGKKLKLNQFNVCYTKRK